MVIVIHATDVDVITDILGTRFATDWIAHFLLGEKLGNVLAGLQRFLTKFVHVMIKTSCCSM